MRDRDRCKSHSGSPPNPAGGKPPSRRRHGGYAAHAIPRCTTREELVASLVERVRMVDQYLAGHPDDLAAHRVAADITTKIAEILRDAPKAAEWGEWDWECDLGGDGVGMPPRRAGRAPGESGEQDA